MKLGNSRFRCWLCACVALLCKMEFFEAQSVIASAPLKLTICDLYREPQKYLGKLVELRATIARGDDFLTLEKPARSQVQSCSDAGYMTIAVEFPEKTSPAPDFELVRDSAFQVFESSLSKRLSIEATLQGRFDPVFLWKNGRRERVAEGDGYGKNHSADARFVLQRISDVVTWVTPRK